MKLRTVAERGVVRVAAVVGFLALHVGYTRTNLGPDDDFWERRRREYVPVLDRLLENVGGYASYSLDEGEYAGTLDVPPEEAEEVLWKAGFFRNPLAALKSRAGGQVEVGSWVHREPPLARRQVHVMLFERDDGDATDLYAHEEYSSVNPLCARKHYRGVEYDPEAGREFVRRELPVEQRDPPSDAG